MEWEGKLSRLLSGEISLFNVCKIQKIQASWYIVCIPFAVVSTEKLNRQRERKAENYRQSDSFEKRLPPCSATLFIFQERRNIFLQALYANPSFHNLLEILAPNFPPSILTLCLAYSIIDLVTVLCTLSHACVSVVRDMRLLLDFLLARLFRLI